MLAPRRGNAHRRRQGAGSRRGDKNDNAAAHSSSDDAEVFDFPSLSDLEGSTPELQSSSQGRVDNFPGSQDECIQMSDEEGIADLSMVEDSADEGLMGWDSDEEHPTDWIGSGFDVLHSEDSTRGQLVARSTSSSPDNLIGPSSEDEPLSATRALFEPGEDGGVADTENDLILSDDLISTASEHEAAQAKKPLIRSQHDHAMATTDESIPFARTI